MNFYAISAIINFITSVVLGSFVIVKSRKLQNITFAIFCFFAAFWSIAYFFWQISTDSTNALFWSRTLMAGAIFIPVSYLHFVYSFIGITGKKKNKTIIYSYLLFTIFLLADLTPYFVNHTEVLLNFKFWPIPGSIFSIFLIIWFCYVIYSNYLLFKKFINSAGIIRLQLKLLIIGMIIGFIGGATNYFLFYRIPVPPIANILVSFYVVITAYAIIRYRSFNIHFTLQKMSFKIFVYSLATTFTVMLLYIICIITKLSLGSFAILVVGCVAAVQVVLVYFFDRSHNEALDLAFPEDLILEKHTQKLLNQYLATTQYELKKYYQVDNSVFLIKNAYKNVYQSTISSQSIFLKNTHPLVEFFLNNLDVNILQKDTNFFQTIQVENKFRIIHFFDHHHFSSIIPLVVQKEIVGFICIGKNEKLITVDDHFSIFKKFAYYLKQLLIYNSLIQLPDK